MRRLPALLALASRQAICSGTAWQRQRQLQQSSLATVAPAAQKITVGAKYLLGFGAAAWASQSETIAENARLAYLIPTRLARDVITAVSIVVGERACCTVSGRKLHFYHA